MKLLNHLNTQYDDHPENAKTDCLWCGGDSLSIDVEPPHQFQCFKCKETGNSFTYIRKFYDNLPAISKSDATKFTNLKKGIKPITLRKVGIKYWDGVYWIPVYGVKGKLMAIHKYVPETNIVYSSPKPTSCTVIGLQNLTKSDTVWVTEGHHDYLTLYPQMTDTNIDLLGTCGSYFSTSLLTVLKDKHVCLLYDNDQAGKDGIDHLARHIKSNSVGVLSLSYLDWSTITIPNGTIDNGFDVRDLHNVFN